MRRSDVRKTLYVVSALLLIAIIVLALFSCTARQEKDAKKAGGVVAGLFGLPPGVGEGLVALGLAVSHVVTGKVCHSRGRKRERTCHLPPKVLA